MSPIRYTTTILSSLLCATSALAGEGLYLGAGVGYGTLDFDLEISQIESNQNPPKILLQEVHDEKGTAVGQVHAGYQWLFDTQSFLYSLAIEGFVDFQSRDFDFTKVIFPSETLPDFSYERRTKFSVENTYGLSAKPGIFLFSNIMAYLDIGITFMQFTDIETDFGLPNVSNPIGEYEDENLVGLRTGVGLEWLITKQFSIDLSWAIDSYDEFTDKRFINEYSEEDILDEELEFSSISNNRFLLSFSYYFDP